MGYSITVESYFSAAHYLRGYRGKCENLHGHNWKVEVTIRSENLDATGMVFDFTEAKRLLKKLIALLDHKQLNKVAYFRKKNPTSERIAEFIFFNYEKKLSPPLVLESVTVWETPCSSATFSRKGI